MTEWHHEIRQRLERLALRPERESEIVDELAQHLDEFVRECEAVGMTREQARRRALDDLDVPGELARRLAATEVSQPLRLPAPGAPARGRWLSQLWQDVRLTMRSLRRRPWFSISVLATIALTIGPATAIVSVGNWLLWTPSRAVAEPDRLVVIWTGRWRGPTSMSPNGLSYLNLADVRTGSRTLSGLAGWQESSLSLAVPDLTPKSTWGGHVTANFFEVLGLRLAAGRSFTVDEDRPPFGSPVVVLSHAYARQAFGSVANAVDRVVQVNGRPMTVIGVAPEGFAGTTPTSQVDVWFPGAAYTYVNHFSEQSAMRFVQRSGGLFYMFIGRLAPGANAAAAQAELDTLLPLLAEQHPDDNSAFTQGRARVFAGLGPHELMRPRLTRMVNGLLAVAAVLLVLGCANVSNLLLSQSIRAQAEQAIRLALGASRGRLIRQTLAESVVLALTGAVAGVALAVWLKQAIQVWMMPEVDMLAIAPVIPMDRVVLVTTMAAAVACGLVAGVAPAWLGTRAVLRRGLGRDAGRATTRSHRTRTTLAAVQLALSLALIVGAALMVTTVRQFTRVDLGFRAADVSLHWFSHRSHGYAPERALAYNESLVARVRNDSRVGGVSLATGYPFGYSRIERIQRPGGSEKDTLDVRAVATDERYPGVFDLHLLDGRYFRVDELMRPDAANGDPVVVSESLARAMYQRVDVVGEPLVMPRTMANPTREFTIVGVMRDTRTGNLTEADDPVLYMPLGRQAFDVLTTLMVVRSPLPGADLQALLSSYAHQLDPALPLGLARSLPEVVTATFATARVFANVLTLLGGIGVVLAAIGLYGLLTQAVGERRREFGIRLAVGASSGDVARLVASQATWITAFGVAGGIGLAVWGAQFVKSYLFGISESDPRVYLFSVGVLLVIVAIAAGRPAWAATRVNPIETLRAE